MNTSIERVDTLIERSDRIYEAIDPVFDGEARYRRMLRIGVNATATTLRATSDINRVGATLLRLPNILPNQHGPLDLLANQYADVRRATVDHEGIKETDARHAIHLMKLSVPYAREHYPHLNQSKVAAYALLHDIIEAYAGDVASLGMTPEQEKQKHLDEAKALVTIREEYGEAWPEFVELIEAYEDLHDSEARFVKTFDKLDPGFTHFHNKGAELKSLYKLSEDGFLQAIDEATQRMGHYSAEFPQLMDDRDELTRRVADVSFQKAA